MYTAQIGRQILRLYNDHRHNGPPLSPRGFFDDVLFPIVFDDGRYLFWPNNAPFAQPTYSGKRDDPAKRQEALEETHEKIGDISQAVGHLFMGGMARTPSATTSGQVSTIGAAAKPAEAYCSWIGAMAGIGVKGGLSMLIDHDEVLLALVDGWSVYRDCLDQTPSLKGNQLETWNAHWLCHRFGYDFHPDDPLRDLLENLPITKSTGIKTQAWVKVLFALTRALPDTVPTVYVYSLGNTNTTIGFRQLHLPDVRYLAELHDALSGDVEGVPSHTLEEVYDTEFSIYAACEQGTIGLKALQPKKLKTYMPGRGAKMPKPTRSENKNIRYLTFQTWIIAMLNNEDLIDFTEDAATALREHAQSDTKGRVTAKRRAEQVVQASYRREFLDALTEVVENDDHHTDDFNRIADEVVKMPSSDFPLFATLLRLKYAVFSK